MWKDSLWESRPGVRRGSNGKEALSGLQPSGIGKSNEGVCWRPLSPVMNVSIDAGFRGILVTSCEWTRRTLCVQVLRLDTIFHLILKWPRMKDDNSKL